MGKQNMKIKCRIMHRNREHQHELDAYIGKKAAPNSHSMCHVCTKIHIYVLKIHLTNAFCQCVYAVYCVNHEHIWMGECTPEYTSKMAFRTMLMACKWTKKNEIIKGTNTYRPTNSSQQIKMRNSFFSGYFSRVSVTGFWSNNNTSFCFLRWESFVVFVSIISRRRCNFHTFVEKVSIAQFQFTCYAVSK